MSKQPGWTDGQLTVFRVVIVAIYTLIVLAGFGGGQSAGEVVFNAVIGTFALTAIVAAGWINEAEKRRDR